MTASSNALRAWTQASTETDPAESLALFEQYSRQLGHFERGDRVELSDIRLAANAFGKVGELANALGQTPRTQALRARLSQWLVEWAPAVGEQLAREFVAYWGTFKDTKYSIPPGVNNTLYLTRRLELDKEGWKKTVMALAIAREFLPEGSDGLNGYDPHFWQALGQWKKEAQSAGMPTLDVPDEGTPLGLSGPVGP